MPNKESWLRRTIDSIFPPKPRPAPTFDQGTAEEYIGEPVRSGGTQPPSKPGPAPRTR